MASEQEVDIGADPNLLIKIISTKSGRDYKKLADDWQKTIENSGFELKEDNDINIQPSVQTFFEEPVVESNKFLVRFSGHSDQNRNLQTLARKLTQLWCQRMGYGLQDQPRLEILSLDGFNSAYFNQAQKSVKVLSTSFGDFANFGLFKEHFALNLVSSSAGAHQGHVAEMSADFLHDYKKILLSLTVCEFCVHKQRLVWRCYEISFAYSELHSILVDYTADDEEVKRSRNHGQSQEAEITNIVLYLRLKNVPKISRYLPKNMADIEDEICIGNYTRREYNLLRLSEICGRNFGCCSAMKLVFPLGDENNQKGFWNFLSRLKCRSNARILFSSVKTISRQEAPLVQIPFERFHSFASFYLVLALQSRGHRVSDHIDDQFILAVSQASCNNRLATEKALEDLLAAVDEHRFFALLNAFIHLYDKYTSQDADVVDPLILNPFSVSTEEIHRDCVRVRKLIVTPTRELLMAPEVMMSNRVLRQFKGEEFGLRLIFRDDDFKRMRPDCFNNSFVMDRIKDVLLRGRMYGLRKYEFLAWSNSQLRDYGCYMFGTEADDGVDVATIRMWMGDFTASESVPKYMSRMAQCFTQAQEVMDLSSVPIRVERDVIGGFDELNNEPYIFSDGIGRMSKGVAENIRNKLQLKVPILSACQIRYKGFKGMLSLDDRLDRDPQGPQLIFRDSMKKFANDTSFMLEIVKHSQPSPVYLNRPLIMILDQVSRKQGSETFARVSNRIRKLLEKELFTMGEMLLSETVGVEALTTRTSLNVDFGKLRHRCFSLTTEPFFRGLLSTIHLYTLKTELMKMKVEIPSNQGRTMFGVLDEYGLLQSGQIFVQYSDDLTKPGENLKVLEGKVMITKNPCVVAGDVRIVTAVYKEALKERMVDVVVFPRNGHRPLTDEMAGSDLGDEYAVFWDEELMFDKNENAMHFPKTKAEPIDGAVTNKQMVDFFCTYMTQDSIGAVSNAHLVQADCLRLGIFDAICTGIALKCSMAVDFPKTGKAADRLTKQEQPNIWPDFMEKDHLPMYRSRRLVGHLYRKVKMVSNIVELGRVVAANQVAFDADLLVDGWQRFELKALEMRDQYVHILQSLLDQYGIEDEFQLISGKMVSVRNRLSDNEKEDFSLFNTEKIVELRLSKIFEKFRRDFMDDFGGERVELWEQPTEEMQQKASAYYVVAYDEEYRKGALTMLSFPWLVWKVLGYVKMHKRFDNMHENGDGCLVEPVQEKLTIAIRTFTALPELQVECRCLLASVATNPDLNLVLEAYGEKFGNVLFVVLHWCQMEKVFVNDGNLRLEEVALLFVRFASGQCGKFDEEAAPNFYIKNLDTLRAEKESNRLRFPMNTMSGDSGSLVLEFVKYLSSEKFQTETLGGAGRKMSLLNSVAFKTYHHVAWTSAFESLHMEKSDERRIKWDKSEFGPLPVKIQKNQTLQMDVWRQLLVEWTGMDEIGMRENSEWRNSDTWMIYVSGVGCLEARDKLKSVLMYERLSEALFCQRSPMGNLDDDDEQYPTDE